GWSGSWRSTVGIDRLPPPGQADQPGPGVYDHHRSELAGERLDRVDVAHAVEQGVGGFRRERVQGDHVRAVPRYRLPPEPRDEPVVGGVDPSGGAQAVHPAGPELEQRADAKGAPRPACDPGNPTAAHEML